MRRFLLGLFLVGCGPSLEPVARTTQSFAVAQRCAQGPFEIHVPAFGSKWGESVTVEARGDAVDGHATVTLDGRQVSDGSFSTPNATPNTSACVLSDAERSAASSASASTSTLPSTSTSTETSTSTSTAKVELVPAGRAGSWLYSTDIAKYEYRVEDWSQKDGVLKRGQDLKIVFWSEHPLDLHATTFVVTHSEMVPSSGDVKWQAHLDEVRADREKALAEQETKVREQNRCVAVQGADKKCHDEGYETGGEYLAHDQFEAHCEELARHNAADAKCRDDGWRNDNERPDSQQSTYVSLSTANNAPAQTDPPKPQGHAADRPPPAPQSETEPPKPSEHAEWIPGSWQWNGFDWVWLGGGWKVPDSDRAEKLTATAPSAPPPVRTEARPAQPLATAVWAEGYWHYANNQWVWVPGHWAVPPRAGATWRASTWVPEGVRLRLNPGGWVIH